MANVIVEAPAHHLGDAVIHFGAFEEVPVPEGAVWQSDQFDWVYGDIGPIQLFFDLAGSQRANPVKVNGTSIGNVPYSENEANAWVNDLSLWFDSAYLAPTGNTLSIESELLGDYDDFMFRNVRLTPEPATLSLLAVGIGTVMLRRRRK